MVLILRSTKERYIFLDTRYLEIKFGPYDKLWSCRGPAEVATDAYSCYARLQLDVASGESKFTGQGKQVSVQVWLTHSSSSERVDELG